MSKEYNMGEMVFVRPREDVKVFLPGTRMVLPLEGREVEWGFQMARHLQQGSIVVGAPKKALKKASTKNINREG